MIEGFPYREYPTGWFQVAWSQQVEAGQVLPLEYFGRKLVAYRGQSGAVHVMDAHCRHMGAHLGFGGTVEGDAIRCPFHGWCWGADGRNTEIPYGALARMDASIRTYPAAEVDGIVLIWFDGAGGEPSWRPPTVLQSRPDLAFFDLFPHCAGGDRLRMQPQMMAENTVDWPHLIWTHRWVGGETKLERFAADGPCFVSVGSGSLQTRKGVVPVSSTMNLYGVGLIVAPMDGVRFAINVAGTTPIDHDYSYVFLSTFVSCPEGAHPAEPDKAALAIVAAQRDEVIGRGKNGDRKIWENQRYLSHPLLVEEERAGTAAIRRWAKQFYPEPTHA